MVGFVAGALTQSCRIVFLDALTHFVTIHRLHPIAWFSVPVNGFGKMAFANTPSP